MARAFVGEVGGELGQWKKEADIDALYLGGKKLYAAHILGKPLHYDGPGKVERENGHYEVWLKECWKIASKGSRLTHVEIMNIVECNEIVNWKKPAPSFSLRFGARSLSRQIKRTY
jgi:hypothetical protein